MVDNSQLSQKNAVKVALMEQKIENIHNVFERLESAIEKIGDVSSDIKQMLAVHEERIETLDDKITHNNKNTLMINESVATDIKELRERIVKVNQDMTESIHSSEHKILKGQEDLKAFLIANNGNLERRVKVLENWRYVLVGGFAVASVVTGFAIKILFDLKSVIP